MSDQEVNLAVQDEALGEPERQPMPLTHAWAFYALAVGVSYGVFALKWYGTLALVYLAIGVAMSRGIMRRLIEFHPMYHTVAVEFSAKIRMVLFWPLQMLGLLFKLTANRVL